MTFILAFLLLVMSLPVQAATWYVGPNIKHPDQGGPDACTQSSPCNWVYATLKKVGQKSSDTVRFLDGVYDTPTGGWRSAKEGKSETERIIFEAVNRRKAKIRYRGAEGKGGTVTFFVRDDNYLIRGIEIDCKASNGNRGQDCIKAASRVHGGPGAAAPAKKADNITFEDLYVHDAKGGMFHCAGARNIEIRNSTMDGMGCNNSRGEGYYLASCCRKNNPCITFKSYNNVVSRFAENAVDFKHQTRDSEIRYTIFADQRTRLPNPDKGITANSVGGAVFVSNNGGGTNPGTDQFGNIVRDSMIFRGLADKMFSATDNMRFDAVNNVIWSFNPVKDSHGNGELNGSNETPKAESYGNIHCPESDNVSQGFDKDHGKAANQLNQDNAVCSDRMNQIIGIPGIASCEIGSVNNTTVVVNLQADVHGPISSVGSAGQLAVQYNLTDQMESAVELISATQARITMASAPAVGAPVRIVPAIGAIKNSAYIGGKDCTLSIEAFKRDHGGTNRNPNPIPGIGGGVCGSNIADTPVNCINNVTTGGEHPHLP